MEWKLTNQKCRNLTQCHREERSKSICGRVSEATLTLFKNIGKTKPTLLPKITDSFHVLYSLTIGIVK